MATYTVVLERDYILRERAEFEVEAENEKEAKEKAMLEAEDAECDWNEIDGSQGDSYIVVSCVEDYDDDAYEDIVDTGKTD